MGAGLLILSGGCDTFGPRQLPVDRFDYNEAIADSASQQMLLNIVRLRYGEIPFFLAVNSVLTQYVYSGRLGVSAGVGDPTNAPRWALGASANALYNERPTITYSPLTGQEFATQLVSPIPPEIIFGLVESGWPPEQTMKMTLQRINDLENALVAPTAPTESRAESTKFSEAIEQFVALARAALVEVETDDEGNRYLIFSTDNDDATQMQIDRFKNAVGLAVDRSKFRVTTRVIGREQGEVTFRIRSLLDVMGSLSRGVSAPPEHLDDGRVARGLTGPPRPIVLEVATQVEPPTNAYVAVKHEGHWYFVRNTDQDGKLAFSLLLYLFQMQAPLPAGSGPLLTVPTG